jgi:hypothetical protein
MKINKPKKEKTYKRKKEKSNLMPNSPTLIPNKAHEPMLTSETKKQTTGERTKSTTAPKPPTHLVANPVSNWDDPYSLIHSSIGNLSYTVRCPYPIKLLIWLSANQKNPQN